MRIDRRQFTIWRAWAQSSYATGPEQTLSRGIIYFKEGILMEERDPQYFGGTRGQGINFSLKTSIPSLNDPEPNLSFINFYIQINVVKTPSWRLEWGQAIEDNLLFIFVLQKKYCAQNTALPIFLDPPTLTLAYQRIE